MKNKKGCGKEFIIYPKGQSYTNGKIKKCDKKGFICNECI